MKVIALSGWKQSGKDTVADYLGKEYSFKRFGFADILKDMVAEQYDIPRNSLDDPALKEQPLRQYPVKTQDAFSEMIHSFMQKEFAEVKEEFGDSLEFVKCWTPRALAILEGSVKRSANSAYWVQRVVNKINEENDSVSDVENFVISDLRYRSEVEQLRKAFGDNLITVRINRFDDSPSSDPSERDLDNAPFDFTLDNKGTLEELLAKVEKLV